MAMKLYRLSCRQERYEGEGPGGSLLFGTIEQSAADLLRHYAGQIQTIYVSLPGNSGKTLRFHQPVGTAGWETNESVFRLPVRKDSVEDPNGFSDRVRETLAVCKGLLRDTGSVFLHVQPCFHGKVRVLADAVFGEENFVNEIIRMYQTAGRPRSFFSHNHDIILFYRKTKDGYFNPEAVCERRETHKNHMRRRVDENGRAYRARVANGIEKRYYEDVPVVPGDIWGFSEDGESQLRNVLRLDGELPARILERMILSTSGPGDLVAELSTGSGAFPYIASAHDRRFIALEGYGVAVSAARRLLLGKKMEILAPLDAGSPILEAELQPGIGYDRVALSHYGIEERLKGAELQGCEALDQVSLGYLRGNEFVSYQNAQRDRRHPQLPVIWDYPVLSGIPALMTVDVLGRRLLHSVSCQEV